MSTFVLVHGSWHGGWCWAPVAHQLAELGHVAFAPTMPGHGAAVDRAGVTNDHCADALVDFVDRRDLQQVILVGHSWGGTLVSAAAPRLGARVAGLVYVSAFVLEPGECQLDVLPPEYVAAFTQLALTRGDRTLPPPPLDMWQQLFMQDAEEAAQRLAHSLLAPEPFGCWETKNTVAVRDLDLPKAYIHPRQDMSLPAGQFGWCPRFPSRLGDHRLVEVEGGHEACLTRPAELAEAIVAASARR